MQLDLLDDALAMNTLSAAPDEAEKTDSKQASSADEKSEAAFKTITEVADILGVQQYVLRFWESKFKQIKPTKMRGGRRYYRPEDVALLQNIKHLLYKQGYTIKGAKKALSAKNKASQKTEVKAQSKVAKPLAEKEISQLAVIRQELISLRDELKPHVF